VKERTADRRCIHTAILSGAEPVWLHITFTTPRHAAESSFPSSGESYYDTFYDTLASEFPTIGFALQRLYGKKVGFEAKNYSAAS